MRERVDHEISHNSSDRLSGCTRDREGGRLGGGIIVRLLCTLKLVRRGHTRYRGIGFGARLVPPFLSCGGRDSGTTITTSQAERMVNKYSASSAARELAFRLLDQRGDCARVAVESCWVSPVYKEVLTMVLETGILSGAVLVASGVNAARCCSCCTESRRPSDFDFAEDLVSIVARDSYRHTRFSHALAMHLLGACSNEASTKKA